MNATLSSYLALVTLGAEAGAMTVVDAVAGVMVGTDLTHQCLAEDVTGETGTILIPTDA